MNYIRTLILKFDLPLRQHEIPKFRGAVANIEENRQDILYHGHDGEELRYAYPLIQYKTINGRAAIVGIADGTSSLEQMTSPFTRTIKLGEAERTITLCESLACSTAMDYVAEPVHYLITNWTPLNKENYASYSATSDMVERLELLKRMLVGNILSFAKGIGLHIESELKIGIVSLKEQRAITYKGQKMLTFNAEFTSNLRLPQFIGLGKGASAGHGVVRER